MLTNLGPVPPSLRAAQVTKFNRVNTLHIFFDREGADHVAVAGLKFYGAPLEGTKDLKELGKKPDGAA